MSQVQNIPHRLIEHARGHLLDRFTWNLVEDPALDDDAIAANRRKWNTAARTLVVLDEFDRPSKVEDLDDVWTLVQSKRTGNLAMVWSSKGTDRMVKADPTTCPLAIRSVFVVDHFERVATPCAPEESEDRWLPYGLLDEAGRLAVAKARAEWRRSEGLKPNPADLGGMFFTQAQAVAERVSPVEWLDFARDFREALRIEREQERSEYVEDEGSDLHDF